jgi:hypothetical protein
MLSRGYICQAELPGGHPERKMALGHHLHSDRRRLDADWTQIFQDEHLTAALLDRLTHRATVLEFVGESFRFRQRM